MECQWIKGIDQHATVDAFSTHGPIFFGRVESLFADIEKKTMNSVIYFWR